MLLDNGANPFHCDSLIISVFRTGKISIIDIFCNAIIDSMVISISYFFDLNNKKEEILKIICEQRNAKILLEKVKEYNLYTYDLPVLCWLYRHGKKELVIELLSFYDLNVEVNGKTILMSAAEKGDNDLIQHLIKKNVNLNFSITYPKYSCSKRKKEKWTALHYAVKGGHYETVALLIESGADLNAENEKGYTPLGLAESLSHRDKEQYVKKNQRHLFPNKFKELFYRENFDNLLKKWRRIIQFLVEKGGTQFLEEKPLLRQSSERQFSCVALITMRINDEPIILLIRKGDYAGNPIGHYLAPGGIINMSDKDSRSAICREILEETTLKLNPADLKNVYEFEYISDGKYIHTTFFHIELPESNKIPILIPKSDAAEAIFVNWSELTLNTSCPQFRNIPIKPSNALLFQSIIESNEILHDKITASIIQEDYEGSKALVEAIKNKDILKVETLCSHGIDLNLSAVLHFACRLEESDEILQIIKILLRYGADINKLQGILAAQCGIGITETPLLIAIRCRSENIIDLLLDNNADVNLGFMNIFPLSIACLTNNFLLAEKLLERGAIIEQNVGGSILLNCIYSGNEEFAIKLLNTGKINLNKKYSISGIPKCYPLELAVRQVAIPFIKLLINHCAHINIITHENLSLCELLDTIQRISLTNNDMIAMFIAQKIFDPTNKNLDLCINLCLINIFSEEDIQLARLCIYKEKIKLELMDKTDNGKHWFLNHTEEKNFISFTCKNVINNLPLIFYVFGCSLYRKAKADNFTNPNLLAKASHYLRKAATFEDAENLLKKINLKTMMKPLKKLCF